MPLHCWICELPVGVAGRDPDDLARSKDHVIPQKFGGRYIQGNIQYAHRWCNSRRGHSNVTEGMKEDFRNRLWSKHRAWFEKRLFKEKDDVLKVALQNAGLIVK